MRGEGGRLQVEQLAPIEEKCPECGSDLMWRRGRFFYGCRRYPECKFTAYHKPIAEPCPDCGRPYLL